MNPPRNVLLVEGFSDQQVIPQFLKGNSISWPDDPIEAPLQVKDCGGSNIYNPARISAELKASGLKALGVIVDADADPISKWSKLRNIILPHVQSMPEQPPTAGWIAAEEGRPRFGVWIMPDNITAGSLETFLLYLEPLSPPQLFAHAKECCKSAQENGAQFSNAVFDEAVIHTWLAWQKKPGYSLAEALRKEILNPVGPKCAPFLSWIRTLYGI